MKKILVIDNYDSFTYNLVQYVERITDARPDVFRNDEIELGDMENYEGILLSPGPGIPNEAGLLIPLIKSFGSTKSILGVCLGHQAIAEAYGGVLENLPTVLHGIQSLMVHNNNDPVLFENVPREFQAGRYHSWVVSRENWPDELVITSTDPDGEIMSLKHKSYRVRGVQFHPESILTDMGYLMLENWIKNI
jgi:anthranilate synthase component 2